MEKLGEWCGGKVRGTWFYSRVGDAWLIKGTKRQDGFKIFFRAPKDGKTVLRSSTSC